MNYHTFVIITTRFN